MPAISLQPKQHLLLDMVQQSRAKVIGVGGGRGAAKSGGADRVVLTLMIQEPGTLACVVMRNWDQVRKFHVEPLLRAFPDLVDYYQVQKAKLRIPVGNGFSELDFSYGESLPDIERRFRSANYRYVLIDQAEQFTRQEIQEIRKAVRASGGKASKLILLFNMGGTGIQDLRKWFHTLEYNEYEDPKDYAFLHVYPWDNVEWVRPALIEDGLTAKDYYAWSDGERMMYAATRGEYTKGLASEDDAIRNRDWLGSWESLEGAYYGRVFDRTSTLVTEAQTKDLIKPWDVRWMSEDWGKSHYTAHLWHAKTTISPKDALDVLGWQVAFPITACITYREMIRNEMSSHDVAREVVRLTPLGEREKISHYFLSHDAFGDRDSGHTIADNQAEELVPYGLPRPRRHDMDVVGGCQLIADLLEATKNKGAHGDTVWLISAACPEILNALPLLMRDPKDLDRVLKSDKGQARLEMDVFDAARYGIKGMMSAQRKPAEELLRDKLAATPDPVAQHFIRLAATAVRDRKQTRKGYW